MDKNSRHVDVFFDVDGASLDIVVRLDVEAGRVDKVGDLFDGEEVGHGAVLTNVVTISDLGVGFEPEKAVKSRACKRLHAGWGSFR